MSYTITNNFGKIKINLTSNINHVLELSYNYQGVAQTPINSTMTTVDGKTIHNWTIPLNQFSIGGVLDNFKVTYRANGVHLWQLNEGITILLNGEEVDNVHSNTYTHTFKNDGEYNIEAVYKGNNKYAMATTGDKTYHIKQPTDTGVTGGNYKLTLLTNNIDKISYKDNTKFVFQLTKGGKPVPNKTVQRVYPPPHDTITTITDANGKFIMVNDDWKVGTWRIGATFSLANENVFIRTAYKTITVNKTDVEIVHSNTQLYKGDRVTIHFREKNSKNKIANEKVVIYINGKAHNKTTNENGNVSIKMNNTGTFKFNVVYKGNDSVNKGSSSFSKKILRRNG